MTHHREISIATSLRSAPSAPKTRAEILADCARAWHERGVIVILDPGLIQNDFAKQAIINEATRLYGKRSKRSR